jgi:hypothetical protein
MLSACIDGRTPPVLLRLSLLWGSLGFSLRDQSPCGRRILLMPTREIGAFSLHQAPALINCCSSDERRQLIFFQEQLGAANNQSINELQCSLYQATESIWRREHEFVITCTTHVLVSSDDNFRKQMIACKLFTLNPKP